MNKKSIIWFITGYQFSLIHYLIAILFFISLPVIAYATPSEIPPIRMAKDLASNKVITTHPLKNEKIGYIDFIPLPPNYPPGYFLNERGFTGELFSKKPMLPLSSSDILFVPKDYLRILESSFFQTLRYAGFDVQKYSSILDAKMDKASVLILGLPLSFHVVDETKAVVNISYKIYRLPQEIILWEGPIETQLVHDQLPRSISGKTIIFMVGNHQFNFQPQRALLAIASNKNTVELLNRLEKVWQNIK
jgi:hypothetical protein